MVSVGKIFERYLNLIFQQSGALSLTLGVIGILYSIGFMIGDIKVNNNYTALAGFLLPLVWGSMYMAYGIIKILSPIFVINNTLRLINTLIGVWAWNYTVFSFLVSDKSPLAPAELILILPILLELVDLSLQLWERKHLPERR